MQAWAPSGEPFRLVRLVERELVEREADSDDEAPKALACYGVYLPTNEKENSANEDASNEDASNEEDDSDMSLRFVEGRPVSEVTTTFLEWGCERLDERGPDVWTLIWDQASWHTRPNVPNWIHQHNERVKEKGRVRILACELPSKAHGSIRSSRSGSTANGPSANRTER